MKPALASATARLDAWLTPPVYTGKPPVMLADGARQLITETKPVDMVNAPFKSELTVRVNHPQASRFHLRLAPAGAEIETLPPTFAKGRESTAEFKKPLTTDTRVELLEDGVAVSHWTIGIIPDQPPQIALTEPMSEAQRGSIKLKYKVSDDYGVLSAEALFGRAEDPDDDSAKNRPAGVERLGKAPTVPLTLPRANTKEGQGQTYRDLTSHYWAGLPVTVTLEARDQAGQRGQGEVAEHHIARAPVYQAARPRHHRAKEAARRSSGQEGYRGERHGHSDHRAGGFHPGHQRLSRMRTAFWRLRGNDAREELKSAADLLWSIAVHIEDGDLSDAERQLRDRPGRADEGAGRRRLRRGDQAADGGAAHCAQPVPPEHGQAGHAEPAFDPRNPISPNQRTVTPQDLERMLKKIEDLARTGSKDAARQMLSELRDILENAQNGRQQAQSGDGQEMMHMLDGLSEMIPEAAATSRRDLPRPAAAGQWRAR